MTFSEATKILATDRGGEHESEAIGTIARALISGHMGAHVTDEAGLCDWIAGGEWRGTETLEVIRAEFADAELEGLAELEYDA